METFPCLRRARSIAAITVTVHEFALQELFGEATSKVSLVRSP